MRFAFRVSAWLFALCLTGANVRADAGSANSADDARRNQVLAKGTGFRITVGEMEDQINKQPPALRARYTQRAEQEALLSNMIRLELLSAEAERRGLSNSPAVQQTLKDGAVQTLLRVEIDEKITAASISAEDVNAYYTAHPEDFHHPAQRRASHIALATEAEAQALLPEAKRADLHAFAELARKHSTDSETKLRGGDLAFFTQEPERDAALRKVPPAIRKAVFALKAVGDTVDHPVATDGRFSLVRYTGERPERHVSLAEADGSIRSRLWRERRQKAVTDLIAGLRSREKPQVFTERVDWVKFDDMERRPEGFSPDPAPQKPPAAPKAKQ